MTPPRGGYVGNSRRSRIRRPARRTSSALSASVTTPSASVGIPGRPAATPGRGDRVPKFAENGGPRAEGDLDEVVRTITSATVRDRDLSAVVLRMIPVEGVAISTLGDVLGSETVSATDPRAECLDEFQFDLGEGPCWDALLSNSPVLVDDAAAQARGTWPLFGEAIAAEGIGALLPFRSPSDPYISGRSTCTAWPRSPSPVAR